MIKLDKSAVPAVLQTSASKWTAELLAAGDKGKAKNTRYGHPEVKAALIAETNGKCAYCESKLLHIAYGDVEHIVAKALDPNLAYEWSNLTIACDKCNTAKSDKEGLLDPYTDDLSSAVEFAGPWIAARVGSDLGNVTVVVLGLNRPELMERRTEKLDALRRQLEVILKTANANRRQLLLDAFLEEATSPKTEFSGCIREQISYLKSKGEMPA
jgi:hypothetical protein